MQLQCRAIDYYSLILVGHGPTLFIFGGAMAYTAYTVPTPMIALPHSPEEKELTEGDPERALLRAQCMQLNETTPIAIEHA